MAELTTYPIATISKLLDLSPRRIRQLVDEGIIPREERGRYALVPAVRGYINFLRERAVNADVGSHELGRHRARKLKAEAEQAEMKSGEMRGDLIKVGEFHLMMTTAFARVRARMLGLPGKVAPLVLGAKNAAAAQALLRDAVHEALDELAATRAADCFDADDDPDDDPRPAA